MAKRTINKTARKAQSTGVSLSMALRKLSATNGSSIRPNKKNGSMTSSTLATSYLYALGCTISTETVDYSLLDDCQTENIENENIDQSKTLARLKAGESSAVNKFANTDDPFYELDDDLPERVKIVQTAAEILSTPNLSGLAITIANMG
jgi:hypothetical protein